MLAHGVQVYRDVGELADSVARFLGAAFAAGDPALVVATPDHVECFRERLAGDGWDTAQLERLGWLRVEDAAATLERILVDGRPDAVAFDEVVGGAIDDLAARNEGREVRVVGEMVDLLHARGDSVAAISLEELWNGLARSRRFSLLCGYDVDVFDRQSQVGLLPGVCRTHSHVMPAADPARLSLAVGGALEEVLGHAEAGKVYVLLGDEIRRERVPAAQLVLMWVSVNMPAHAERVLASARERYLAQA